MTKFHVSYAIEGSNNRRYLVIDLGSQVATSPDVACAIIKHEFPNVCAPFGVSRKMTAELALLNLGITQVRAPVPVWDCYNEPRNCD
jgi:hypothetical protein